MNTHEEQFALLFIVPEKRARYLSLLESKRGREKLLEGFYHCPDLDSRFAKPLPAEQQSCIAGKLAYFELKPFDGRYILER